MTNVDAEDPPSQELLQQILASARAGTLRHSGAELTPELARRLAEFRGHGHSDAEVVWVGPDRMVVLVEPLDGGDLFLLTFAATTMPNEEARH